MTFLPDPSGGNTHAWTCRKILINHLPLPWPEMHMSSMDELADIRQRKLETLLREIKGKEKGMSPRGELAGYHERPVSVGTGNFSEFVSENELVIVDCWAPWCKPCLAIAPTIEALAKEYAGKAAFGKLNVDEETSVAQHYGIMGIPTLLIFKGGQLVDRVVGNMPRARLEEKIKSYVEHV